MIWSNACYLPINNWSIFVVCVCVKAFREKWQYRWAVAESLLIRTNCALCIQIGTIVHCAYKSKLNRHDDKWSAIRFYQMPIMRMHLLLWCVLSHRKNRPQWNQIRMYAIRNYENLLQRNVQICSKCISNARFPIAVLMLSTPKRAAVFNGVLAFNWNALRYRKRL